MAVKLKSLDRQVIVITGASSGIGLAAARLAADRGAKVVLTARSDDVLAEAAREINEAGGEAVFVAADVAQREELEHVADVAIEQFGGFDTWVNDAAVGIYGRLDEVSDEDSRRLFETNFWGAVNGSLIAVEHLRQRGGVIINIGSVASDNAIPYLGMYSASKHALKGFSDALRMELELEDLPVLVTLIKPTSINTPFPHNARNYMEREPRVPPPVYSPNEVARAILHAATHPVRDIYVGSMSRIMSSLGRSAPRLMDRINEYMMVPKEFRDEPPRQPMGALHEASRKGQVYGDEPAFVRPVSVYTEAAMHPMIASLAAGAAISIAAMAVAWLVRNDRTSCTRNLHNGSLPGIGRFSNIL